MRYQQRHIQTGVGIKNRLEPMVTTSTDFCVYSQPTFNLSAATKINCFSECKCPSDYTLLSDDTTCQKIATTGATVNNIGSIITRGNQSTNYGQYGAYFFPSIQNNEALPYFYDGLGQYLIDASGGTITATSIVNTGTFWVGSASTSNGRLNNVGLSASSTEYVGFSKCLDLTESGVYYVGIASDNFCRLKVNGVTYLNLSGGGVSENFKIWTVIPFTLEAGLNIIEMEGSNVPTTITSFGCEIYKPTNLQTLTASTTTGTTGLIFSSLDKVGGYYDLGNSIGYSCPSGYSLNTCGEINCVSIARTGCTSATTTLTTASTSVHIFDDTTQTIKLDFEFTGNTNSLSSTTFSFDVYPYSTSAGIFYNPSIYNSNNVSYSAYSATNVYTHYLPVSALTTDGEYLIKGNFVTPYCTEFLNRLGKTHKVSTDGTEFQLYNSEWDFYLIGIKVSDIPEFRVSDGEIIPNPAPLFQEYIYLDYSDGPVTIFTVEGEFVSDLMVTKNGYLLNSGTDFSYTGNVVTLISTSATTGDVITAIYNKSGGINIHNQQVTVTSISSGVTDSQGLNTIYYNTTTGKYELYTETTPVVGSEVLVAINSVMLTTGIDYSRSTSNENRIILEGLITTGDTINLIYYPKASLVGGISASTKVLVWSIDNIPTTNNGYFVTEVSTATTFTNITYSSVTQHVIGVGVYSGIFPVSGSLGSKLYYRVKNVKRVNTICGNVLETSAVSEVLPVTIKSTYVNSY